MRKPYFECATRDGPATTLSIEKNRVQAQISLTPGVAVSPIVLAGIDTDADGVISETEQRSYAERVLRDLSLTVDGERLGLGLVSSEFARTEEMKEGRGDIRLKFNTDLPRGGPNRRLIFESHHLSPIAAYLVNCLVPRDPDIQIAAQHRKYEQSLYELDYVQAGVVQARCLSLVVTRAGMAGHGSPSSLRAARIAVAAAHQS